MGSTVSSARTPLQAGSKVSPAAAPRPDGGGAGPDGRSLAAMPVQAVALVKLPAPPATPSVKRKSELCPPSRYAELDRRVSLQAGIGSVGVTLADFTSRLVALVDHASDDVARLRALFYWLASVDVDGAIKAAGRKADKQPDNAAVSYLLKIQRRKGNYAHLMAALCNCAGIPARIVTGVTKSASYRVGKPIERASAISQWNAVHVAGEWRLLDCLWASTCVAADDGDGGGDWELLDVDGARVTRASRPPPEAAASTAVAAAAPSVVRRINDFFFLPDPAELGATHFPDDAEWQLVDAAASWTDFENGAYVRERFFQLGARATRPELSRCALRADPSGAAVIELHVEAADSPSVTFKYVLSRAKAGQGGGDDIAAALDLRKCVFFERRDTLIRYTIHFPASGAYKFDVYGRDSRAHAGHDLMCSYLVTSDVRCEHFAPLPDEPAIGWGPGASCDAFGITAVSHLDGRIDADSGEMDVVFALQYPIELRHELVSGADAAKGRRRAASHPNCSILTVHEGVATVSLRIAKPGVYALKLFAGEERIPAELQNVCNYLITLREPAMAATPATTAAFPPLVDGHLGMTSYCRELGVEPVANRHPVIVLVGGGVSAEAAASDGRFVELSFAYSGGAVELSAALSTALAERIDGADASGDRCRRTLACEGCYSFRVDVRDDFELLVRLYACRAGDPQRLYNVYNCLVRAPRNAAAAAMAATPATVAAAAGAAEALVVHETATTTELAGALADPGVELTKMRYYLSPASDQATLTVPPSGVGGQLKLKLLDQGEYRATIYERTAEGYLQFFKTYAFVRQGDHDDRASAPSAAAPGEDYDDLPTDAGDEADEVETTMGDGATDDASKAAEREMRRAAQQALQRAVNAGALAGIQSAIADYLACGGAERNETMKAARRVELLLQAAEALRQAMESSSVKPLQDALVQAKAANAQGKLNAAIKLNALIKVAEHKLAQLLLADQLSRSVFSLDQRTMSEMKAYANPPEAVYLVAKATLLLLGTNQADIKDWRQVQVWLGKSGQESLKRRVMAFDYRTTPVELVVLPKQIYGHFTQADVRGVSAGAATFFTWGTGMIGLIEQLAAERQENHASVD